MAVDKAGRFLFVADSPIPCTGLNITPQQVFSFTVATSGVLTAAGSASVPDRNECIQDMATDPTGANVYTANDIIRTSGTSSMFSVDQHSGAITLLGDVRANNPAARIVIHPGGRFAYLALQIPHLLAHGGGIQLMLRDPATGTLTSTDQIFLEPPPGQFIPAQPIEVLGMAFTPDGALMISHTRFAAQLWRVDLNTGALKLLGRIPGPVAEVSSGPFEAVTVDRTGRFAIFTLSTGEISSYGISQYALRLANSQTAPADTVHVVIDPSNRFVYAQESATAGIVGYSFDQATGTLAPLAGSPFTTSNLPMQLATISK
jgi:6-phosphogluconolactonase (cycloisomerase 2 family)